jgi:cytidyltransferase-like protein
MSTRLSQKLTPLSKLAHICDVCKKIKKEGNTVGLVTGKFDILHPGHLDLLEYAKKKVDVLIVGIDNDKTIEISKNKKPLFNQKQRSRMLSELVLTDFLFVVKDEFKYDTHKANNAHTKILNSLKPSVVITNNACDGHYTRRKDLLKELNINLLTQRKGKIYSSSKIAKDLTPLKF